MITGRVQRKLHPCPCLLRASGKGNGTDMTRYVVRANCEYSRVVDADSEDAAIAEANQTDVAQWDQAWSPMEAEPEDFESTDG